MSTQINITNKLSTTEFYNEYHGHKIIHLKTLLNCLKYLNPQKNYIYLAGDSSLDNKHWLTDNFQTATNSYEFILNPPQMKPDVAYHINTLLTETNYCCINAAIEESTIASRDNGLLPQDKFIKDNITNDDILVVSIGGNDIALKPSMATMYNMGVMMTMNDIKSIKKGPDVAWGMTHFITMFKDGVRNYILKVIGDKRPKKIIICMIYYPDEQSTGSWADTSLGYLGYNTDPKKLQAVIRQIFIHATSKIEIEGSQVIPFPMFKLLNGKFTEDYVQRAEPSNLGGYKLALGIVNCCL